MGTQLLIRKAAVQLFAKKGFEATSIRDIAREAGINSATLYHYINSKDELLIEIMADELKKLIRFAQKAVEISEFPGDKLAALSYLHVKLHALNQLPMTVTDHEYKALYGDSKVEISNLRKIYENIWKDVIEKGVQNKSFTNVKNIKLTTFALLSMNTGVVHWFSDSGPVGIDEISQYFSTSSLQLVGCDNSNLAQTFKRIEKEIPI